VEYKREQIKEILLREAVLNCISSIPNRLKSLWILYILLDDAFVVVPGLLIIDQ
jgi:hypothetical protein